MIPYLAAFSSLTLSSIPLLVFSAPPKEMTCTTLLSRSLLLAQTKTWLRLVQVHQDLLPGSKQRREQDPRDERLRVHEAFGAVDYGQPGRIFVEDVLD